MNFKHITLSIDLFFLSFGYWTLLVIFAYFIGMSFSNLALFGILTIPAICFAFTWYFYRSEEWPVVNRKEIIWLCLFVSVAIIMTLCLNRPDADDQRYLGMSILALDYAKTPIKMIHNFGYYFKSHEFMIAALTYYTGIPVLTSYYLVIPAFLSIFVILIHYKLLTLLVQDTWIIGIFFFFIVMLAWGDVHRTYANFGFVRLFQGKAGLVSIIVPAIIYYFFQFINTSKNRYLLLLLMAIVSGVGFTATGIIVGLLLLVVLILASIGTGKSLKHLALIASLLVVPVSLGLIMRFYFGVDRPGVVTARGFQEHTTNIEMIKFVFGNGYRGWFALICFIVSPLLVSDTNIKTYYRNFVLICLILLLFPWTSELIAWSTYPTASWRWLWIMPIPMSMCLVIGKISTLRLNIKKTNTPIGYCCVTFLSLLFIFSSNRLVLSEKNNAFWGWPSWKIEDTRRIWLRGYKRFGVIKGQYIYIKKSNKMF